MNKKIDITGWCSADIKAACVLAKILEEEVQDEKITYKCGVYIQKMYKNIKHLSDIKDKGVQGGFLTLSYKNLKESIKIYDFPDNVKTHLLNTISTIYKIRLEEIKNEQ
jgi:hypothetical protein